MQVFSRGPAPTGTQTFTGKQLLLWAQVWVCPNPWHSLKKTVSLTARLQSAAFFLLLSCKTARHTVQAWLYSVFLSCIPASLQQHISRLPLPLLSFSSLLSAMTTMLPLGHHLPFIQHFSFHSLFEKTLACSRCCSTVSDPCCKTKTPIMLQARLPV